MNPERVSLQESVEVARDLAYALSEAHFDIEALLNVATATLSRVRRGTWMAVVMCDDTTTSRVVVADDSDPAIARYIDRCLAALMRPGYAPTTGLSRSVIESGEAILLPQVPVEHLWDYTTDAHDWLVAEPFPIELRSAGALIVPMRASGQIVGTLGLTEWNPDQPLSPEDQVWLQPIADQIGLAVEQADSRRTSITRQERIGALQSTALAISSSDDLRLTLHVILARAVRALRVHAADVLVLSDSQAQLRVAAAVGFHSTSMPDYRLPLVGERVDTQWLGYTQRRSLFAREGFRVYRAVSLLARSNMVGVLEVFHRSELETDPEWLSFLEAMSSHAAVAIDLARARQLIEEVARSQQKAPEPPPDLSAIDRRILSMIAQGATNYEISSEVHLSIHTVKFHVRNLCRRLDASNRIDLALKAVRRGWA